MTAGVTRALGTRRAMAIAIALTMALAARSLTIGFVTDDHAFRALVHSTSERAPAVYDLFRFEPGDRADNQLRIRYGFLPWWAAPDLKIHFFRPLTSLAFAADVQMFDGAAVGYHAVSLAWYLALLIAAAFVFRRLLPPEAATLALAVFGLSAAHVDAYAWVSARHVAIAGALATGALAARWSRHRWLAPLVYAVALASSEAALAVAPLWIALELATPRSRRARGLACIPVVALSLAYLVIYAALGGGTRASGGYHDPLADPLGFAALAAVRVPLLLGDAALGIPAELAHVIAEWRLGLAGLAAVGFVALAWWLTAPARRPASAAVNPSAATPASTAANPSTAADRPPLASTLAWLAAGGIAATVLGAAGFPSGRVLVIPDLAFAAVLGVILARGRQARWPGRVFAIALAVFHLVIAPIEALRAIARHEHRGRATEAIAQQIVELAPPHGRVLLVAASDPMVFLYPRGVLSDVAPGTARCWSTWSAARASHRITRTSAHTLAIEPIGHTLLEGSFDELFRAADQPFEIGATVEQCGATIRVAAVTGGRPARLEVTLRRSLDDPEIVMLVWRDHRLARFTPPRVGETVELPWSPGPSDLTARP